VDRNAFIQRNVERLTAEFPTYLRVFEQEMPFTQEQLRVHLHSIKRRRILGTAAAALEDDEFLRYLHNSLLPAWGIGVRESRLVDEAGFLDALRVSAEDIAALDNVTIDGDEKGFQVARATLTRLLGNLPIVDNKARIVAVSKTLHHLLPDLVPPIDRKFTGSFFRWHRREFQDFQRRLFQTGFDAFRRIALDVNPVQYVGEGWRTSRIKILDNAIIGFCIRERLPTPL
jgi:hypothetical protein